MGAWFVEEHQGELCVFSELGWLDISGNWSDAAAEADLSTLSPNVTAALSEDSMQQCMEEEMAKLEELATATAGIKCFTSIFHSSCKEFVGGKVYEALYASLAPLAG